MPDATVQPLGRHIANEPKPTVSCKNCSRMCAYHCTQLSYTTQHRIVLIILPLILHTNIIARMQSIGGGGGYFLCLIGHKPNQAALVFKATHVCEIK